MKRHIIVIISVLVSLAVHAQNPLLTSYAATEYGSGTQNWDIDVVDGRYVLFANNDGLLIYDSDEWATYPIQNGTSVRSVLVHGQRIYVGASREFGYFEPCIKTNTYEYHSLAHLLPADVGYYGEIWDICQLGDNVFFADNNNLFVYSADKQEMRHLPVKDIKTMSVVGGQLYVGCLDKIYLYNNGTLSEMPGSEALSGMEKVVILPYKSGVMVVTTQDGVYSYADGAFRLMPNVPPVGGKVFSADMSGSTLALGTISNGIAIIDLETGTVNHANNATGLHNNTVLSVRFDKPGQFVAWIDNGVAYVMQGVPLRSLDGANGIGTGYVSTIYRGKALPGHQPGLVFDGFARRRRNGACISARARDRRAGMDSQCFCRP